MHLIIDCTTTQNQLKNNGIGQYTKHIVKRLVQYEDFDITLLMFNGESTLDPYIKSKRVKVYRLGKARIYFCPYFWIGIPSLHIPTVLAIHDLILPIFNIYSEKGVIHNFIKKILYWLEIKKAKYCKAIVTCSKCTAKDFSKYFPKYPKEKIHTIYLDAELEKGKNIKGWDSGLPKDYRSRGYFIYMGGAPSKSKNSDGVIKGYREFLSKLNFDSKAPYLIIAGKNFTKDVDPNVSKLKDKVKCLGLKGNVIFTGFYEDIHVTPLLKNSIAFIHLSLYEGFGIALVEAMRVGTPVIAHKGSCYKEVLGDGGVLVDGLNPKEVSKTMRDIYENEKLREELIKRGKEKAKIYSWDSTVEQTVEVFRRVARQSIT